jgi:heme o synthase
LIRQLLSLLSTFRGQPSAFYCIGALLLGLGFYHYGTEFVLKRTSSAARRLLMASIIYLPALFALMVLRQ